MSKEVVYFFGGSFDPWHNDHSKIVGELLAKNDGRKILIAPSYNPWKNGGLLTLKERIKLIKELFTSEEQVVVLEEGFPYTVEFVEKYASSFEIILVMGQDAFETYPQWKEFSKVKSLVKGELVIDRSSAAALSSSSIRSNLKGMYGRVPQNIYNYLLLNYLEYPRPSLTADAIVVNQANEILLIQRLTSPFKNSWVFPGGFINQGEHPQDAALRELAEETMINSSPDKIHYVDTFGALGRDPRGWTVSQAFVLKYNSFPLAQTTEEAGAFKWAKIEELLKLEMGFDHQEIALRALRLGLIGA